MFFTVNATLVLVCLPIIVNFWHIPLKVGELIMQTPRSMANGTSYFHNEEETTTPVHLPTFAYQMTQFGR